MSERSARGRPVERRSGRARGSVWYGLMALAGFGFGLLADRRPFGDGILVHPLVVFFALVGLRLLGVARRIWRGRCRKSSPIAR